MERDYVISQVEDFKKFIRKIEKQYKVYLSQARVELHTRFEFDQQFLESEEEVKEFFDAWKKNILKRYPMR